MRTRRTLLIGLAVGVALGFGTRELSAYFGELIGTTVVKSSSLRPVSARGETVRTYIEAPTSTLLNLGLRSTTLDPGTAPSVRPNSTANESLVVVRDGTLEVKLDAKGTRVEQLDAGSAVFLGPNQWHALRNAGTVPVTYFEIDWISPGMNGEPHYPESVVNRRRLPTP
jgi:mannose-6-phosphate isomerase-like protein (cupin superfamily)